MIAILTQLKVERAIGKRLAYDVTILTTEGREVIRRGTTITKELVEKMKRAGHNIVYVFEEDKKLEGMIMEDKAIHDFAEIIIGEGVYIADVREGSAYIRARFNGLLKVHVENALKINEIDDLTLITRKNFSGVLKDELVCIFHIIPLYIEEKVYKRYTAILQNLSPVIEVKPFIKRRIGLVITGTEVFEGRINDKIGPIVKEKVEYYGGHIVFKKIVPDNINDIGNAILECIMNENVDIVIVTGGMSVDPTDLTPKAIAHIGAKILFYGVPIKPNTSTLLALFKDKVILGVPSGIIRYPKRNILDILLPRLMAGELWCKEEIASLGVGGLMEEFIREH